jgi:hypothetical protein
MPARELVHAPYTMPTQLVAGAVLPEWRLSLNMVCESDKGRWWRWGRVLRREDALMRYDVTNGHAGGISRLLVWRGRAARVR